MNTAVSVIPDSMDIADMAQATENMLVETFVEISANHHGDVAPSGTRTGMATLTSCHDGKAERDKEYISGTDAHVPHPACDSMSSMAPREMLPPVEEKTLFAVANSGGHPDIVAKKNMVAPQPASGAMAATANFMVVDSPSGPDRETCPSPDSCLPLMDMENPLMRKPRIAPTMAWLAS